MAGILLIVSLVIPIVLLYLLWSYSYWYRRGIPQGNPLKLLGDLNDITVTFLPYWKHFLELGRKFSDKPFYGVYSLGKPHLLIRDPEMIRDVFTRKFSSFSENGFAIPEEVEPVISRDPFFQKGGEKWKESRASFSSIMTPSRLRNTILPEIVTVSQEAVNYLKEFKQESGEGDGTNVKDFALRYMTNILIRVTLSVDAGAFKAEKSPFLEQAENMFDNGIQSFFLNLVVFILPQVGSFFGLSTIPKDIKIFWENVIKQQKQYREENGIQRDDIFNMAVKRANDMQIQKGENEKSPLKPVDPDLEILSTIIMFFMEGFETSSTTIAAAMASLAKHEELQENLRREILKVAPLGKEITEDAINNVPLLNNCVLETMRMYPPGVILQRVVTENVTLEAKTGEIIHLKKGTYLNIPIASIHRDPAFFPDPENFDPDRFEDETQRRYHLGFGDGPRQCPGQKFALLAMKVMLAVVLREFKLELSPKTQYPLEPINNPIIFALKDVRVRLVPL